MIVRNIMGGAPASAAGRGRHGSDALIGLTDRDVFMANFEALVADARLRERGLVTLCIDIDRFARINETLGRTVGDAVLQVTAKRIERCLLSSDRLVRLADSSNRNLTQISGDEFVLVLADIDSREDVSVVASRLREAFEEPVVFEGHEFRVSPSIGISMYPLDGNNADELLKNARVALGEAKIFGVQGREFYSSTMKFCSLKRLDVKKRTSLGDREGPARAALPAAYRPGQRSRRRTRGFAALAASVARQRAIERGNPAGGGYRPDIPDRGMGAANGMQSDAGVAAE